MDLESLSLASALVSPFPTWEVEAADEPRLLAALAAVGSFPQADIFEPWDEAEAWRARVVFPDLERASALIEAGTLAAGESPGLSKWLDRGRIGVDLIEAEGGDLHGDASPLSGRRAPHQQPLGFILSAAESETVDAHCEGSRAAALLIPGHAPLVCSSLEALGRKAVAPRRVIARAIFAAKLGQAVA